jgi:hypothetical protein
MGLRPFLLPLFTGVRGIGILRTSPSGHSRKFSFHFTEFCEVRCFPGALAHFVSWRTYTRLSQEYAPVVTWPVDAA